jgi:hypothetical protein
MSKAKKPRNADHVRRKNAPMVNNEVIEERLKSLLTPAILGQQGYGADVGATRSDIEFSGDGGGGVDAALAPGAVGV